MTESELILLPFTRLEFQQAVGYPLISNMNSIRVTRTTLKSLVRVLGSVEATGSRFFLEVT